MSTLNQRMRELSSARRRKVEARAAELVSEEMTLQELRQARKLTQVRMAKALRITQDGVSRLERRTDLLLSTLRKSVEAMGGSIAAGDTPGGGLTVVVELAAPQEFGAL